MLAAAIIALSGITFGIVIGQHRALRLQHGLRDNILRRDEFNLMLLATEFFADGFSNCWISFCKAAGEKSG